MSWDNSFNSDEEEDSEFHELTPNFGREGIIFLIDCRKSMFEPDSSKFTLILQCCRELMLQKIQLSPSTLVSIMLFGVEKSDCNRKHIVEFQSLAACSAEKIKEIDFLMSKPLPDYFTNKYGHETNAYLADALFACLFSFSSCTFKLGNKRVLLFTDDDSPDADHADRQHQVRRRASDLSLAGVDLEVIPVLACSTDTPENFNAELFYKDVLQILNKEDHEIPSPFHNFDELWDFIDKDRHTKRSIARVKFNLGNQVMMGIGVYKFTSRQRLVKKAKLSRETNEPVRTVREILDVNTGAKLRPYDVLKTTNIGRKDISFTKDELLKMRRVFEPGLVLLGFRSRDFWKIEYHCSEAFFIFPEESLVKGSNVLFIALLKRCSARNLVAVCALTTRRGSRPRFVVLVPQEEVHSENKQELPAGFHVFVLPFARLLGIMPTDESYHKPNPNKIEVAKKVIKKIKLKTYVPDFFENPALAKHWNFLESLAVQPSQPKPFEDYTVYHYNKLDKILKEFPKEFNDLLFDGTSKPVKSITSKYKRKIISMDEPDNDAKIPKKSEFIDLASQRKLDQLKVAQLKAILNMDSRIQISSSAKRKSDLVELIYKHFESLKKNYS